MRENIAILTGILTTSSKLSHVMRPDGLVLTAGFLIAEAEAVWITSLSGRVCHAHPIGYDFDMGFGLLQALEPLDAPAITLGRSGAARVEDSVQIAGSRLSVEHRLLPN